MQYYVVAVKRLDHLRNKSTNIIDSKDSVFGFITNFATLSDIAFKGR